MKSLIIIFISILSLKVQGQDEILTKENIYPFILKVDSLNQAFESSKRKDYFSIQHTNADYVRIITKEPERFTSDLNLGLSPNQILKKYKNAIVDKNVLITKTKYTDYRKESSILFQSYEIGNNKDHNVKIPFDEIFFDKLTFKGKYVYESFHSKDKGTTRIDAFYILSDFKRTKLDSQIASYIDYSDLIIRNENIFKYPESPEIPDSVFNPIDSLFTFFNIQTNKPNWIKDEPYPEFKERLNHWDSIKQDISDSLFINSKLYSNLLIEAKKFAFEIHSSNSFLEHLVDRYISKEESFSLMRISPMSGKQSFDSSPINQQLRICKTAAVTLRNFGQVII